MLREMVSLAVGSEEKRHFNSSSVQTVGKGWQFEFSTFIFRSENLSSNKLEIGK